MNNLSNHYSLQNTENYKSLLENSLNDIVDKYILLACEYLRFIIENITIKNRAYFKFILIRGLETITHVFNNILLYTKNLEMAYYHGQKAFYYYVEFIGQISEEQHQYLQLSSRDATMYVYKKTLFEITNELKKISTYMDEDLEKKIKGLNIYIQIYKNIVHYVLRNEKKECGKSFELFTKRFEFFCNKMNSIIFAEEELKVFDFLIDYLNTKNICTEKYLDFLDFFITRASKKKYLITEKKLKRKIFDELFDQYLEQTPDKFVSWLIF